MSAPLEMSSEPPHRLSPRRYASAPRHTDVGLRHRKDISIATDPDSTEAPIPNPDMAGLDRLVGTWEITGDAVGEVTYEWMPGRFFLVQRFRLTLFDHTVEGVEIIGHTQAFGESPSTDIHSRAYDNSGNTLDYVYDVTGDMLTIWGGERGAASFFTGRFIDDNTNSGAWVYEGGGGYATTMTRRGS